MLLFSENLIRLFLRRIESAYAVSFNPVDHDGVI